MQVFSCGLKFLRTNKSLFSYELCTGVENEIAKKASALDTKLMFGSDLCHCLVKNKVNNEITKWALNEKEKIKLLKFWKKSSC